MNLEYETNIGREFKARKIMTCYESSVGAPTILPLKSRSSDL